ncbi:Aste57867_25028 [Aphanomyces stellatus]|uniref:sphingomyelin phosphodiesterase n=1 Tax=Aphanomyces stellatus TaxID=120398 RepID=A0A485LSR5_9STRA|nr:hypothetical protein As57867_024950 [Aphanomyces stellatus]VFU01659.1 Aste57867_25028 [Aphanomyces stellatus]
MRGRYIGAVLASLLVCGLVIMYIVDFIASAIPHPPSPTTPPAPPTMALNVVQVRHAAVHVLTLSLQYNVFGRPTTVSQDGQHERLQRIPDAIAAMCPTTSCGGVDVVTFAEADIDADRRDMLSAFHKLGFPYHTNVIADTDPFTSLINGGVLIVSKWPILREAQHIYRGACHYSDCLAAKGVKYARLNKTVGNLSKAFNVFATHMQAWSTKEGCADRIKQAQQFHTFAEALAIPHSEPLVFAGDFNVDNHSFVGEVDHLIELLHATSPRRVGDQLFTSDPRTNVLVGRDGAAHSNQCNQEYIESWGPLQVDHQLYTPSLLTRVPCHHNASSSASVSKNTSHSSVFVDAAASSLCFCPCCPLEWLDYILYAQLPYQQPIGTPTLEAIAAHATGPAAFTAPWSSPQSNARMRLLDYSDHYPVLGKFTFAVNTSERVRHLDGCSTDSDCRFNSFRCYCEGPGCFYQGSHTDGTHLPSTHPVNKNCLLLKTRVECSCGPT